METIDIDQISQGLDSAEGIFSSAEGILASLFGIGSLAVTGISAAVSLTILIVGGIIALAEYLLETIPLFIMARRAGCRNAWMAFFPYTNDFLSFTLPIRQFNIFNLIKTDRRDMMALIYLGLMIIGNTALGIIITVFSYIPGLNLFVPILTSLGAPLLWISIRLFRWRMMYDILMTFGQKSNALWVSIVAIFVPWLFNLFTIFSCKNPPEYGLGNYHKYRSAD